MKSNPGVQGTLINDLVQAGLKRGSQFYYSLWRHRQNSQFGITNGSKNLLTFGNKPRYEEAVLNGQPKMTPLVSNSTAVECDRSTSIWCQLTPFHRSRITLYKSSMFFSYTCNDLSSNGVNPNNIKLKKNMVCSYTCNDLT